MEIKWTRTARQCFKQISSDRYSPQETMEYKKLLVKNIERKIATMMEIMPSNEPEWNGTYRVLVDNFKVYYSFSDDFKTCYIEAFKHQHQK